MKRGLLVLACVCLVVGAMPGEAASPFDRGYQVDEFALKALDTNPGTPIANPTDTVQYSDTIVGGPEWDRPYADFSGISGLGPVRYHEQMFWVDLSGSYDLTSVQTYDGYLLLYIDSFDPTDQLTNGVAGDDDGAGGIGTSDIIGVALEAGRQYFLITTAFANGDEGTFTNTLTGPGVITLGPLGGMGGDLEITLTSAAANLALNEPFTWDLGAANLGGGTQTNVVVTGTYPASVTVSGTSCGATAAGGTITWNLGTMADGAGDTCTVNATLTSCAAVPLTAAIGGDDFDPPANNSATLDISISGGEAINDGGFESGTPSAGWAEASTNFGTPICDIAGCGTGTGTGPHTGDFWVWFGGISAYEQGSVSQTVTIDPGASVDFWVEAIICDSVADYVELTIDGNQVWSLDGGSALCGNLGYTMQTVSLAGYDDGASHTLAFHSEIFANNSGGSNFFIDDVSMISSCDNYQPPQLEAIPTVSRVGLFLMIGLMAGVGIFVVRKFA